jgi:hypothetical protein
VRSSGAPFIGTGIMPGGGAFEKLRVLRVSTRGEGPACWSYRRDERQDLFFDQSPDLLIGQTKPWVREDP